ncbi:MAG: ABC transporter permease [Candidatus Latescibacterota bacterium]|nr:MAG: ABC transporter permease [Candidatus Latescibacterota bacterium]
MGSSTPALDTLDKKASAPTRKPPAASGRHVTPSAAAGVVPAGRKNLFCRLRERPLAYAAAALLGLVVCGALLAPLLSPHSADAIDISNKGLPPSFSHPFGTDDMGRDLFLRVLYGGRISIAVGVVAVAFSLVVGIVCGGAAGYFGGLGGAVVMRTADLMMSIPVFLIVLLFASLFTPGFFWLCVLIGSIQWMEVARVVRSVVISTKQNEFVLAAKALGVPELRILWRHVLPHTTGVVFVTATLGIAQAIMIESTLSFLGFGLQPPAVSWGGLLRHAQGQLAVTPWTAVFPGLMIFLTVLCCYILGDFLKSALNPTRRSFHRISR